MATPAFYSDFRIRQHNGNAINLASAAIKVALLKSTYAFNSELDTLFANITAGGEEVAGSNYTAGGVAITGQAMTLDGAVPEWVHDDVSWAEHATGFTNARYAVWYATATGRLIMAIDLATDRGNINAAFTLDVDPLIGVATF